jgi:hypothetical protein
MPERIDFASVVYGCTTDFSVHGMKTEPPFVEPVEYERHGDRFSLRADVNSQHLGPTLEETSCSSLRLKHRTYACPT